MHVHLVQNEVCTRLVLVLNVFEAGFERVRAFSPNMCSRLHGFKNASTFSLNRV